MSLVVGLLLLLLTPFAALYAVIHATRRAMRGLHDVPPGTRPEGLEEPSRAVSLGWTLAAAAFVFTLTTTFVPVEITAENSRAADFGHPFRFVTADTALSPPQGETARVGYDPWEYRADFHVGPFLASWAVVSAILLLPLVLISAARRPTRARPLRLSARRS